MNTLEHVHNNYHDGEETDLAHTTRLEGQGLRATLASSWLFLWTGEEAGPNTAGNPGRRASLGHLCSGRTYQERWITKDWHKTYGKTGVPTHPPRIRTPGAYDGVELVRRFRARFRVDVHVHGDHPSELPLHKFGFVRPIRLPYIYAGACQS